MENRVGGAPPPGLHTIPGVLPGAQGRPDNHLSRPPAWQRRGEWGMRKSEVSGMEAGVAREGEEPENRDKRSGAVGEGLMLLQLCGNQLSVGGDGDLGGGYGVGDYGVEEGYFIDGGCAREVVDSICGFTLLYIAVEGVGELVVEQHGGNG